MQFKELSTAELMRQALHWCHMNEDMANDYLRAYYERYLYEKHGYAHVILPSLKEYENLSVLDQRTLLEKWHGIEEAIKFEQKNEFFNMGASTVALNNTRASIYANAFTNTFIMVAQLRRLNFQSYCDRVAAANMVMTRVSPKGYELTTAKFVAEIRYWYDSATCFVERPLVRGYAQRAYDSGRQYEELKQSFVSNYIVAFLCGTRNDSKSLVKLLDKELLSMILSFLLPF